MLNLNEKFLNRMQTILGKDYPKFLSALEQNLQKGLTVNTNKISVNEFKRVCDFPLEKIAYDPNGFFVENDKYGKHPLHHAGAFYMQEPSAMFTVNAHNFVGNEKVIDLCAAPGGKSIQLALRVPNGLVVSNEIVSSRANILFSNIERMGLKNVLISNDKVENLAQAYGAMFDVCLVDAPCSGEGMFRRGEQVVDEWNENLPTMCAERQLKILDEANKLVKVGGYIIYSTCTYSLEENENVVNTFLSKYNYELQKINSPFNCGVNMPEVVRIYPHINKGEGQFVAVLKKLNGEDSATTKCLKLKTNPTAQKFLQQNTTLNVPVYDYNNYCYVVPDLSFVKPNVNYVCPGVRVGSLKNNRLEPEHFLFTAFGTNFVNKLELNFLDAQTNGYLHGESLNCSLPNGYGAVLINGCPVGGTKVTNGVAKNHYPKGLRNFN